MKHFYSIAATVAVAVGMIALLMQLQGATIGNVVTASAPSDSPSLVGSTLADADVQRVPSASFSQSAAPAADFPLMDDATLVPLSDTRGTTSYQTAYSLEEVMAFYRAELALKGATERQDITKQSEGDRGTFRMVFDDWEPANGASVVVEGATVNADLRVITLRLETNP
jgi:hypothetical protein